MTRTRGLWSLVVILAAAVAPPAMADTFLVYSNGGISRASELYTWCDAGQPCDVSQPLSCAFDPFLGEVASPEGGSALRVLTSVWGGWGVFPQGYEADLSAYENGDMRFWVKAPAASIGPFNVKIEFQCNPDPVNIPGGVTYTTSIADQGWDGTTAWQEISIPICDFFPGGICDTQCLATVKAPFMATIENLPFFNQFWIDYVRWETPNNHAGASPVEVQGRQLTVNGEPFVVNGVGYAPLSVGENWQGAWRDRPDRYDVDFPLMAASGVNTVRLYAPVLSTAMLDAAWANGLHVIPSFGVDVNQLGCATGRAFMQDRFVEMVNQWKDHPAVLAWMVGNEFNTVVTPTELCQDWYPQLDALAQAAHAAEGSSFHPVGTANADTPGLADICQAGCSDDTSLPNLDFWAAQVYRGCSFQSTFDQYALKSDCERPLIISEFGMDAYDSLLGAENEILQANCLESLLDEADQALAVRTPGGVSSGQVVFEWLDEWWKAECDPGTDWAVQDTCASSTNAAYPDPATNEEWFGIVSQDSGDPGARGLRTAHTRLEDAYQLGAVCNVDVVAHNPGSGDTTVTFDPAGGSADHTLYYGPLSAVSTYGYSGSASLGASGTGSVTLPSGSLFWVIAARNNGLEGCYGTDSAGAERSCNPNAGNCAVDQVTYQNCQCSP